MASGLFSRYSFVFATSCCNDLVWFAERTRSSSFFCAATGCLPKPWDAAESRITYLLLDTAISSPCAYRKTYGSVSSTKAERIHTDSLGAVLRPRNSLRWHLELIKRNYIF